MRPVTDAGLARTLAFLVHPKDCWIRVEVGALCGPVLPHQAQRTDLDLCTGAFVMLKVERVSTKRQSSNHEDSNPDYSAQWLNMHI